jgi:hypothetical protein
LTYAEKGYRDVFDDNLWSCGLRVRFCHRHKFLLGDYVRLRLRDGDVIFGSALVTEDAAAQLQRVRDACEGREGCGRIRHMLEGMVHHHQIIAFLESRGGHATVAEIAAAVPTSEPIGDYLREMVYQGIIVQ